VKFIDEVTILVQSGDGGRGCVSFRRERFIPRGGPDGGDGGSGGSVILRATSRKHTLYHLHFNKQFKAPNGGPGQGSQKTGRNGTDIVIDVPAGTLVYNADSGDLLYDLTHADQQVIVARGGRGGVGNLHFKSSTNRAPRFAQPGEPGQTLTLKLELKLMADVGIVGLPNAGKSTLISAISGARPKIADYPFTTLIPNLGVVQPPGGEPMVVADIPGLIEGAHAGSGLGIRFLRHVERTRILVHLIDAAALDENDLLRDYRTINRELTGYSGDLAQKPQIVVLNKLDVDGAERLADLFCRALGGQPVLRISAATRRGLDPLIRHMQQQLNRDETPGG
jgi:GTP-binding protein